MLISAIVVHMFVDVEGLEVSSSNGQDGNRVTALARKGYLWLCYALFVVAAIFVLFGIYSKTVPQRSQRVVASREYVVKPGDTLYSIALRFSDGADLNQYIFQLEQEVPGNAEIYPGEVISLPNE